MAKKPNAAQDGDKPEVSEVSEVSETVRLTIAQVAEKAAPLFADADKAEDQVEKQNTRWLDFARETVAPHLGAIYNDREKSAQFRYSFYRTYCDTMGKWKPAAPAKTCGEDFQHYNNLKSSAKDEHPTANSIKAAINRAKVYFSRVINYTRDILEKKEETARGGPRGAGELFMDTLKKLLKQSEKVLEKEALGKEAASIMQTLLNAAKMLEATTLRK